MKKLRTSFELEKELENLKVRQRNKENLLSDNIYYMIIIGGGVIISILSTIMTIKYASFINDINAINLFNSIFGFGFTSLEIILGIRAKKLTNEINIIKIDIRKKKSDIVIQKLEDIKKASEIVDSVVEKKDRQSTYRDDYSSVLNFNEKDLENAGSLIKKIIDGNPVNINPLQDIPESEIKFYALIGMMSYHFFTSKKELNLFIENNNIKGAVQYEIEYIRHLAGRDDVLSLKRIGSEKQKFYTACNKDGYGEYNEERSTYKGEFIWEYNYGTYLEPIYNEVKNRGINLEHDVYGEYNEMIERVMQKVKSKKNKAIND